MNNHEIDEMLREDEKTENNKHLNRKLRRSVNKQIYSRILLTFLAIAIVIGGGSWISKFYLEKTSYRPQQEDQMMFYEEEGSGFSYLLELFLGLHDSQNVKEISFHENAGSGKYQFMYTAIPFLNMSESTDFSSLGVKGGSWGWIWVSKSKLSWEEREWTAAGKTRRYEYLPENAEIAKEQFPLEKLYQEVKKLPESCLFDAALSFEEEKTMDQIAAFILKHPDIDYYWMATEISEEGYALSGLSLRDIKQNQYSGKLLKTSLYQEYPYLKFFENTALNGETLTSHYLSILKLLLDHEDFLEVLETAYPDAKNDLQQTYDNTLANGIYGKGLRCVVSQPELLSLIENGEIDFLCIYDLKLSYLQQ